MKILWFPRLQYDIDRLHLVTWRKMAESLEKHGHVVRVAVCGIPKEDMPSGWIRLPLVRIKGLRLLGFWVLGYPALYRQLFCFRPDVIILDVQSAGFAFPAVFWKKSRQWVLDQRTPISHTSRLRSRFRHRLENGFTACAIRFARRHFSSFTVITRAFKHRLMETFRIPAERIGVWGSGVDVETFDPNRFVSVPSDGCFQLFQHGELSSNRGILETIQALAEPGLEQVELVLLGQGPAEKTILQEARNAGVSDRVRILPPVPHKEVPARLSQCRAVILAYPVDDYWNCNHPIKFAEALAMGKVVICTPLAITRELGPDPEFLEIIPNNRPASIAEGIRRCMAEPHLAERGRAGTEYIQKHGTWQAQVDRLLKFINRLQEGPAAP